MQHAEISEACEMLGVFRSIGGGEAVPEALRRLFWAMSFDGFEVVDADVTSGH
jgi:hypothetical protein